jgi:type II secretory pathway pseudopilin PulG
LNARLNAVTEALRRRHRLLRDGGERGTSLIELIVGMMIMSVCGAIFLGSAVTLSRVTAKTQSVTSSASQTNLAYLSLDKTVRYASAIATPGKSSTGRWYVEFRSTTIDGTEECTQLRLDNATKQLEQRTWDADTTPVTPAVFRQISTGFTNGTVAVGAATQPFVLKPDPAVPEPTANHQRLIVTLVSAAGTSGTSSASESTFTLTALNSMPAPSGSICQQGGRP